LSGRIQTPQSSGNEQGEETMENENEQPEVVSLEVTKVIERLVERQTELEGKVAALELLGRLQAGGLELLKAAVDKHQRVSEVQTGYEPPDPRKAPSN
jgi:hypothetical protein